jgi:5-methylthioadenosine/S-adenosylhomocysteine deaminase
MTATDGGLEVDLVIRNIEFLITVDPERRILRNATVVVDGGRFVWIGRDNEMPSTYRARRIIDGSRFVGTPGMIDCHQHSSFQLARGLADEANAREFLIDRMYPYEAVLDDNDVRVSASLASREMLLHGTTCFADPGNNHPSATVEAVTTTGQRMVLARSAFDLRGSDFGVVPESMVSTPEQAQIQAQELIDQFDGTLGGRIRTSVSFRGLNNSSDELIKGLSEVATAAGAVLQTHAAFSYSTHDASVAKYGMSEISRLASLGVLNERTMLVHCGWLEPEELRLLQESGAGVVAAPSSSMHNGYGNLSRGFVPELRALGVPVALGSDHACSGPVDLVREMFLVSCGYKEARANPRVMPPEAAVEMATIDAARILGLEDEIGSIEVGKRADLVLFDTDNPSWQPLYNPVSNLVYSATGSTADTVLVDGQVVALGGRLVSCNEADLVAEGRETASKLYRKLDGDGLVTSRWSYS